MSGVTVQPLSSLWTYRLGTLLYRDHAALNRREIDVPGLLDELRHDAFTLIATEGIDVVGFAALRRGTRSTNEHVANLRIHVTPDYQRNGVGGQLLDRALEWADAKGIERVVATPYVLQHITEDTVRDVPKIKFFLRHGFTVEGVARKFAKHLNGAFTSAALLARVRPDLG